VIRPLGPEPITGHSRFPTSLAFAALGRHPEPFLTPQPLTALAVDIPALIEQVLMRAAIPPPRPTARKRDQLRSQRRVILGNSGLMTLGGAVLTGETARPTLREPETFLESQDRTTSPGRAQKFPADSSLSP
jgi:hypothetical protein